MHTTFAIESNDSPAPGIIPEPAHVHDDPAKPTRRSGQPAANRATSLLWSSGKRSAVSIVLAKLRSAIRGDKYTIDAYPPAGHGDVTTRDGDRLARPNHCVSSLAPGTHVDAEAQHPGMDEKSRRMLL
jgi:hypothetical protein